jgi:hypothetical protein
LASLLISGRDAHDEHEDESDPALKGQDNAAFPVPPQS